MATRDFLLPDLGEGLTEGEIVSWLVAVGDTVAIDQPVAEVETAKAVVEVPSPFAGTVAVLHGEVGGEIQVGAPLVTIDVGRTAASDDAPMAEAAAGESEPGGVVGGSSKDAEVADMVPQPDDDGGSGNVLVGYGTGGGGRSRRRRAGGQPAASTAPAPSAPPGRSLAKPPVRKLARDLGVDLATVTGTGPEGSITRDDLHAHAGPNGEQSAQPAAGEPVAQPSGRPAPGERRIPLRGVRKAIAEKMTISRREIPEATTWVDVDATAMWELRQRLNASSTVAVSPLAIVLRACVAGLRRFPEVNARLDTNANEIVLPAHVNLGVAAQTDRGLVVPVIKDAHRRSIVELAEELGRLADAARAGKLTPEEMSGGTFTVSNYGSFGVDGGSAVINHPEAAILGVGRIADRPWAVDGTVKVRKVMQLSIAFDHRICDGGEAAGFLRFVADCVESTDTMLGAL